MFKRSQESTTKEGSAVAKPRPMSLVSRTLLNAKQSSPKDAGASDSPVSQELDHSSVSWSTRKLVRGDDNQIERTWLEIRNVQISDQNLRQKLNLAGEAPVLDLKTNVLIWGSFLSTTMKASVRLGPNYKENLEVYRYTGTPTSKSSRICSISGKI